MLEKSIEILGIIWVPCGLCAFILAMAMARHSYHNQFIFPENGKLGEFVEPLYYGIVTWIVMFAVFVVVGFVLYGGLSVVKNLWNAA